MRLALVGATLLALLSPAAAQEPVFVVLWITANDHGLPRYDVLRRDVPSRGACISVVKREARRGGRFRCIPQDIADQTHRELTQ